MTPYRFLLDESVKHLKPLFPRKRAITIADAGLSGNASDAEIVKMAWELEYIIVTANGDDFVREVNKFQRRMMINNCRELSGLLVVPDGAITQERAIRRLEARLRFGGVGPSTGQEPVCQGYQVGRSRDSAVPALSLL